MRVPVFSVLTIVASIGTHSCTSPASNSERRNAEKRFAEWIAVADSNMSAWNIEYYNVCEDSLRDEVMRWERYVSRIIEAADSAAQVIAPYDSSLCQSAQGVSAFAGDALFYARVFLRGEADWGFDKCSSRGGHTSMALQDVHYEMEKNGIIDMRKQVVP